MLEASLLIACCISFQIICNLIQVRKDARVVNSGLIIGPIEVEIATQPIERFQLKSAIDYKRRKGNDGFENLMDTPPAYITFYGN